MVRPRSLLMNTIGVAVLVAVLVVAGHLTSGSLRPPPTTATLPALVIHPTSTVPSPVVARIRFRQPVTGVAVGPDAVWAAHGCAMSRVDPQTNRVVAKVAGTPPRWDGCAVLGVRVGAGAVWASVWGEGLLRIDPRRNRVVGRDFAGGQAMVAADGTVWATRRGERCRWSTSPTPKPAWTPSVSWRPARERCGSRRRPGCIASTSDGFAETTDDDSASETGTPAQKA